MDCWCRRGRLVIGGGGCDVTVAVLLRMLMPGSF